MGYEEKYLIPDSKVILCNDFSGDSSFWTGVTDCYLLDLLCFSIVKRTLSSRVRY